MLQIVLPSDSAVTKYLRHLPAASSELLASPEPKEAYSLTPLHQALHWARQPPSVPTC